MKSNMIGAKTSQLNPTPFTKLVDEAKLVDFGESCTAAPMYAILRK